MKLRPPRIWNPWLKVGYILATIAITWTISPLLRFLPDHGTTATLVPLLLLVLGARIFRGRGEDIDPPRSWWRMTSRPAMSRRLGIALIVLTAILTITTVLDLVLSLPAPRPGHHAAAPDPIPALVLTIEYGILAFLYLNSARRLGWTEPKLPKIARSLRGFDVPRPSRRRVP